MDSTEDIVRSMDEHPEQWTISKYTASHSSGLKLWIANGRLTLGAAPDSVVDACFVKRDVWRAYERMLVNRVRKLLTEDKKEDKDGKAGG